MNTIQVTTKTSLAICGRPACAGCKNCRLVNQQKNEAEKNGRKDFYTQLYGAELLHYNFYYPVQIK